MNLLQNRKILIVLISIWGLIVYLPSINTHFINDEIAFIKRCEAGSPSEFFSLLDKKDFDGAYYRPLGNFISGVTGYFFDYNFRLFRIFNILLHTLNGLVIFYFSLRLLSEHLNKELISFAAALLFISFPVNDYAVIWHTDLFDRMVLPFYLLSLIFFLKFRSPGTLSLFFFLLALLTKEMAFSLPLIIVLLDFFIIKERSLTKIFFNALPYLLLLTVIILFRISAFGNNIFTAEDAHSSGTIFSIIKNYIVMGGIMIFPFFLREVENALYAHTVLISAAGVLILVSIVIYSLKARRKDLLFIFLILFVLVTFLPASRLLMRWYLYLPSAGFAILISYTLFTGRWMLKKAAIAGSLILLIYTAYLIHREFVWVSVSQKGYALVKQLKHDFAMEISSASEVHFITIPAKVNDIPLFHLAFDHHLKHFIEREKEYYVFSRSIIKNFNDTIKAKGEGSILSLQHTGSNYFLIAGEGSGVSNINFQKSEEPDKIYFTFSDGKFYLIKDIE